MIKILFLLKDLSITGGVERVMANLSNELSKIESPNRGGAAE